jgi:transposase
LAKRGYNRDGKRHKLQIVFGCTAQGCPVAVEVGNVGDPSTLANQIQKVNQRFGIAHIVLIETAA